LIHIAPNIVLASYSSGFMALRYYGENLLIVTVTTGSVLLVPRVNSPLVYVRLQRTVYRFLLAYYYYQVVVVLICLLSTGLLEAATGS
jgi:hypothetical protein